MGLIRAFNNRDKVLGLNARFLHYIRPHNKRKAVRIADDKLLTKAVLEKAEIPVPKLIMSIDSYKQVDELQEDDLPRSFVLKPVHGIEGGGIEIFFNKTNGHWIRSNRSKVNLSSIKQHMRDVLEGRYSLFNEPDQVLIEERVKPHSDFKQYTYKGATPDVRVIVFNSVPVMAMLRLPTEESDGKANMALGAIGAAIDIASGKVMTAVKGKKGVIDHIPHNNLRIAGLQVPEWDQILKYAVKAQRVTNLGFASVDFLIDRDEGPKVVELNARTGLSIQLADQEGLRERLERLKDVKIQGTRHGIRLGKDLFGGEIAETLTRITGKKVIGPIVKVKLYSRVDSSIAAELIARVDTGAYRTSVDENVLRKLGYAEAIDYFKSFNYGPYKTYKEAHEASAERTRLIEEGKIEENPLITKRSIVKSASGTTIRPILDIDLGIVGKPFKTEVTSVDRSDLSYQMIIGRRDLNDYLIDTTLNQL